jgi:hypothetical protein
VKHRSGERDRVEAIQHSWVNFNEVVPILDSAVEMIADMSNAPNKAITVAMRGVPATLHWAAAVIRQKDIPIRAAPPADKTGNLRLPYRSLRQAPKAESPHPKIRAPGVVSSAAIAYDA